MMLASLKAQRQRGNGPCGEPKLWRGPKLQDNLLLLAAWPKGMTTGDGSAASIRDAFCADLRYEPAQLWATLGDAAMRWDLLKDVVLKCPHATRG